MITTVRRFPVPLTVDASGDGTGYSSPIYGELESIAYVKTDFANGVDFVITTETGEQTLWAEEDVDASAVRHPRAQTSDNAGAGALYVALGEAVNRRIGISADRVKVVVSNAGDSTSGTFHVTVRG